MEPGALHIYINSHRFFIETYEEEDIIPILLAPWDFFSFHFSRYSCRLRQWNKKYFFVLSRLPGKNVFISLAIEVKSEKPDLSDRMLG